MLFNRKRKLKCFCCGYLTLGERFAYDICPVCFWEDDAYLVPVDGEFRGLSFEGVTEKDLLDIPSGANHGLTLREGRENYLRLGACTEEMVKYVRKPRKREIP